MGRPAFPGDELSFIDRGSKTRPTAYGKPHDRVTVTGGVEPTTRLHVYPTETRRAHAGFLF